jgi:hypothetical protein
VAVTVYSGVVDLEVVGESHYQENLSKISAIDREPVAWLLPEPENPYDPNAVAIWVPIPIDPEHQDLLLVGYPGVWRLIIKTRSSSWRRPPGSVLRLRLGSWGDTKARASGSDWLTTPPTSE